MTNVFYEAWSIHIGRHTTKSDALFALWLLTAVSQNLVENVNKLGNAQRSHRTLGQRAARGNGNAPYM